MPQLDFKLLNGQRQAVVVEVSVLHGISIPLASAWQSSKRHTGVRGWIFNILGVGYPAIPVRAHIGQTGVRR